jgi:hypothetical protein
MTIENDGKRRQGFNFLTFAHVLQEVFPLRHRVLCKAP